MYTDRRAGKSGVDAARKTRRGTFDEGRERRENRERRRERERELALAAPFSGRTEIE
jgi:hypothetical protein